MRLIDADALKKDLKSVTLSNGTLVNTNAVLYLLEEYPTAYDVDKVLEQLENERKFWENAYNRNFGKEKARSYEHAIEIVEGGGDRWQLNRFYSIPRWFGQFWTDGRSVPVD